MRKHIHKGQIISRCRPAAAPLWATRIYQLKSLHCFALWEVTITIQNPSWLDKVQGIRPIIYTLWFQYLLELWRLCYEIKVKRARKIQLIMHRATSAVVYICVGALKLMALHQFISAEDLARYLHQMDIFCNKKHTRKVWSWNEADYRLFGPISPLVYIGVKQG